MFQFAKNFYYVTYYETSCPGTQYETHIKHVGIIAARSAEEAKEMLEDVLYKTDTNYGENIIYSDFWATLLEETDIVLIPECEVQMKSTIILKDNTEEWEGFEI